MMKIFSPEQLKNADQQTLVSQNISADKLMERAATLAYQQIIKNYKEKTPTFKVFCGVGNNGGDGLVIARKIFKAGYNVSVFIVEFSSQVTPEFSLNLNRCENLMGLPIEVLKETENVVIDPDDVVIDAIFGIGLNRSMPIWINDLVDHINTSKARVYAIDTPSGMFAHQAPTERDRIIKAYKTLTFQSPKLAFYLPETADYTGEIHVLNIGLDKQFLTKLEPVAEYVTSDTLRAFRKVRKRFSHKGTYGHCLVVGGSYGKMGSVVLATQAALRVGAGKVTAFIPRTGYSILQTAVPEAMTITGEGNHVLYSFEEPDFVPEAICFGMGAGLREETAEFFLDLLKVHKKPLLIDADGLNLLAKHPVLQEFIPENSVLTPHPKELQRLIGTWENSFEKVEKAKAFAKKHQVLLVLKDAITLIMTGDKLYVNSTGNPGMATAGSGDVLSGVIAGLMAQGYTSEEAAVMGVYLHGRAGDLAAESLSEEALVAGDLINTFAQVFKEL